MATSKCLICLDSIPVQEDRAWIDCPTCGRYAISGTLEALLVNQAKGNSFEWLGPAESRRRANLSAYLYENPNTSLNTSNIKNLLLLPTPGFNQRRIKLLHAIEKQSNFIGQEVVVQFRTWRSRACCVNEMEVRTLIEYLESEGTLAKRGNTGEFYIVKLQPRGWQLLESLAAPNRESAQGFVAMSFSPEMLEIYESNIAPAIRAAGYEPTHVGKVEFTGDIIEEITRQVRRSRFIVADFTDQKHGVYWEAGFALGMGLPVFWTCRQDFVGKCHFDTNHFNHIVWTEPDDLGTRLTRRIEAMIGHGPIQ